MIVSKFISAVIKAKQRILTVTGIWKTDARDAYEFGPYGYDGCPVKNIKALYTYTASNETQAIIGYQNNQQLATPGEVRIYSTNSSGVEQCRIWWRDDGKIELGGTGAKGSNTKHAAQYEGLATAYNQLKADHDTFVSAFNAHVHPTPSGPSSAPTAVPGVIPVDPSTGNITGAKLNNILTE